jgi:hypothetical protein
MTGGFSFQDEVPLDWFGVLPPVDAPPEVGTLRLVAVLEGGRPLGMLGRVRCGGHGSSARKSQPASGQAHCRGGPTRQSTGNVRHPTTAQVHPANPLSVDGLPGTSGWSLVTAWPA